MPRAYKIVEQLREKHKWEWIVYAGTDGDILVHPGPSRWQPDYGGISSWKRLKQTWNENGYWKVSIARVGQRPRTESVSKLVAYAFGKYSTPEKCILMHLNGNKNDNRPENLEWGDAVENRRAENSPVGKKKKMNHQCQREGLEITLTCQLGRWTGKILENGTLPPLAELDIARQQARRKAGHIVEALLFRFHLAKDGIINVKERWPEKFESYLAGVEGYCRFTEYEEATECQPEGYHGVECDGIGCSIDRNGERCVFPRVLRMN